MTMPEMMPFQKIPEACRTTGLSQYFLRKGCQDEAKSVRTSKSGSPELRKALFLVMDCLIQTKPQDDPVYQFMDKKRAEGKPYLVYMTAGANKFLRIYYGTQNTFASHR